MSLQKNALRQTRVFDFFLVDVKGIIVKVVIDSALSDPEILVGVLDDWLLEISHEIKDLYKLILGRLLVYRT
jgi:hypothetical protein